MHHCKAECPDMITEDIGLESVLAVGFANMSAALSAGQEITSAFSQSLYYSPCLQVPEIKALRRHYTLLRIRYVDVDVAMLQLLHYKHQHPPNQ